MSNGDLDRDTRMGMPVAQYQVGAKLSPRISQGNVFARSAYLRLNAVTGQAPGVPAPISVGCQASVASRSSPNITRNYSNNHVFGSNRASEAR